MPSYGASVIGHQPLEGAGKEGRGNWVNGHDCCLGRCHLSFGRVGEAVWWWWWYVSIDCGEGESRRVRG